MKDASLPIRIFAVIGMVAAAMFLGNIVFGPEGHEGHDHEVEEVEETLDPATMSTSEREALYIGLVRAELPELRGVSDDELIRGGHLTCFTIEHNGIEDSLLGLQGQDEKMVAVIFAASLTVFCPELRPNDWDQSERY